MHRSIATKHPAATDIEWRVSMHQPHRMNHQTNELEPVGEAHPVVELYHRQADASWKQIGRFTEIALGEVIHDLEDVIAFLKSKSHHLIGDRPELGGDEQPVDEVQPEPEPTPAPRRPRGRRVIVAEDQ